MWCDNCDDFSYSSKTTMRITADGREILIMHCVYCKSKIELERKKGNTIRVKNEIGKK